MFVVFVLILCVLKDECSFVSLRDVERAMIVFKYFYEKMDTFAPLISKKQQDDEEDSDVYEIYDEEELRVWHIAILMHESF